MKIFNVKSLFDSHCHLNDVAFDLDRENVVNATISKSVNAIIDVAVDLQSAQKAISNSLAFPELVWATVGIHPETLIPGSELFMGKVTKLNLQEKISQISDLITANQNQVVMIGECGIDLFWLRKNNCSNDIYSTSRTLQINLFEQHLQLAELFHLPLSIHARDDDDLCFDILHDYQGRVEAVFHSFTGDYQAAKDILDLGYKIGINGIITFNSAQQIREAIKSIIGTKIQTPEQLYQKGILLETDAPLLSFGQNRGKRNVPEAILELFQFISNLFNLHN
ncbi:MAG: TatD family hydrolase [bacterium]